MSMPKYSDLSRTQYMFIRGKFANISVLFIYLGLIFTFKEPWLLSFCEQAVGYGSENVINILQNPGEDCLRNITQQRRTRRIRKTNSGPCKNWSAFYAILTKFSNVNCPKEIFLLHISQHRWYLLYGRSVACTRRWFFGFKALYTLWWLEGHLIFICPSISFL